MLAMSGNYNYTREKVSDKTIIIGTLFLSCPSPQSRAESTNAAVQLTTFCVESGRTSLRRGQKTNCDVQLEQAI